MKYVVITFIAVILFALFHIKCNKDQQLVNSKGVPISTQKLDSIATEHNIKPSQIQSATTYTTITKGEIKVKVDTVFVYRDKWTEIKGETKHDTLKIDYSIKDSISLATYEKKTGFLGLGGKHTFIDLKNYNPNVAINNLQHFEVKFKPLKWSIGAYIGYGWNGTKWQPSVGVSLSRSIIRF